MECWLPEELPNLSFSHVWSSSPAIVVPRLFFGVTPTSPGFATLDIKPQPGLVAEGAATLPTVRGAVRVTFAQGGGVVGAPGGCMSVTVGLPGGVVARVLLPLWGDEATVVREDGEEATTTVEGDYAVVAGVAPGEHTFTTC